MSRSGQKIVGLIQDIATRIARQHAPQLFFGEVLEVEPLKIKVDDRYEITDPFIVLDSRCKETWIKIPEDSNPEHVHKIQGSTKNTKIITMTTTATVGPSANLGVLSDTAGHTHEIEFDSQKALEKILLWRGLEAGDKVKILRVSTSIHYILERVEGITNDPK